MDSVTDSDERRAMITTVDPESGWISLHFACVYGRIEMVNEILEHCPDLVDAPNRAGWRPLHYGAGFGKPRVIDRLIEGGAQLDTLNVRTMPCLGFY